MMELKRWHYRHHYTDGWCFRIRIWRLQIGARLLRHAYGVGVSDRWVLQPNFVYDRKKLRAAGPGPLYTQETR